MIGQAKAAFTLAVLAALLGCAKADRTRDQKVELGRKHKTAADLFQALRDEAKGGTKLAANSVPDWSGVYSRPPLNGFTFDPDQPAGAPSTARLTPEYQEKLTKRIADVKRGIEWDPISECSPPGHPRWLTEPFLREFIVTPEQTWLINEMVNDIRRVYTDGRAHVPEEDRYPTPNGDSIGFWDGDKLVIHTNQLQAGIYQRSNPDYTDQVETVEIWQKVVRKDAPAPSEPDAAIEHLIVDVWVYDPPALSEPWYVRQSYGKISDPEKKVRIRYWNCGENPNNAVVQTKEGSTAFKDLNFSDVPAGKGKP